MSEELTQSLLEALRSVIDPELGHNIVDLGLVYEAQVEDGRAAILLTTTVPGCPATDFIRQAAEARAAEVPGITTVAVTMTWEPPWSPDRMTNDAKTQLGVAW